MLGRQANLFFKKFRTYFVTWKIDGNIVGVTEVGYKKPGIPPEFTIASDRKFTGWRDDYSCITSSKTIIGYTTKK